MHLAQQRHQQRCLPGSGRADNKVELAALEDDLVLDPQHIRSSLCPARSHRECRRVVRPGERCVSDPGRVSELFRYGVLRELYSVATAIVGLDSEFVEKLRLGSHRAC